MTHDIVAAQVSLENVHDAEVLPTLLNPLRRKEGLAHWKKISGYHRRSLAETTMYRFKQLLAGKISLRNYKGQVGKAMGHVCAMNKLNTLGLPARTPPL